MSTRCGDLDPTAIFHCRELVGSDTSDAAIESFLNTQCGFKGLCGASDIREVEAKMLQGTRQQGNLREGRQGESRGNKKARRKKMKKKEEARRCKKLKKEEKEASRRSKKQNEEEDSF